MVFSVVMYGCESWTIKKPEHLRIDAFELWCWGRFLTVLWTARRSNQSILKEINPEYSLKGWCWNGSSNTLATWCEELTHWKRPWSWERWKEKGERGSRGWDYWLHEYEFEQTLGDSGRTEEPGMLQSVGLQRAGHDLATEQQQQSPCWSSVFYIAVCIY